MMRLAAKVPDERLGEGELVSARDVPTTEKSHRQLPTTGRGDSRWRSLPDGQQRSAFILLYTTECVIGQDRKCVSVTTVLCTEKESDGKRVWLMSRKLVVLLGQKCPNEGGNDTNGD